MRRHALALIPIAALCLAPAAFAENAIIITPGLFSLSHNDGTIAGTPRQIGSSMHNLWSLAYEARDDEGVAFGGEFQRGTVNWSSGSTSGQIDNQDLMFTAKRYQDFTVDARPFYGVGGGLAHATFGGGLGAGSSLGIALEVDGGVEFHWSGLGFYTELKGMYAQTGTFYGSNVNLSGIGAFAGVSFLF